jgi:chromosomal replication initiation ATPase DnaA
VAAVEDVKKEKWEMFNDRHGDWGRDMAFWVARRRAGMTINQLGEMAGGLDYSAVSEAIRRFERKKWNRAEVKKALRRVLEILNMET